MNGTPRVSALSARRSAALVFYHARRGRASLQWTSKGLIIALRLAGIRGVWAKGRGLHGKLTW